MYVTFKFLEFWPLKSATFMLITYYNNMFSVRVYLFSTIMNRYYLSNIMHSYLYLFNLIKN